MAILIAWISNPLNIALLIPLIALKKRCGYIGQLLILASGIPLLWCSTYHPEAYRLWAYSAGDFWQTLMIVVMMLSIDVERPMQFLCFTLMAGEVFLSFQYSVQGNGYAYSSDPILRHFSESLDMTWTFLWAVDLYTEIAATPLRRFTWQQIRSILPTIQDKTRYFRALSMLLAPIA